MNCDSMSGLELGAALDNLKRDLEDIEEMVSYDYMFTSAHIGGHQVKKDAEKIGMLREKVAHVQELLSSKSYLDK